MKKRVLIPILLVFFLSACAAEQGTRLGDVKKKCNTDSDCVPAKCCHPDNAVNRAHAPDCQGVYCTQVCEPGTIDCNQGEIKCVEKQCKAVLY